MIDLEMGNNLLIYSRTTGKSQWCRYHRTTLSQLNYLYVVSVEIDIERTLDRLDGDDKTAKAIHRY